MTPAQLSPHGRSRAAHRPAGPPVLVAHDPCWATRADRYLTEIRTALHGVLHDVETCAFDHIGSTAVPCLAAKDVVDLQVRVPVLPDPGRLEEALAPAGWLPATGSRPDSPGVHRDLPAPSDDHPDEVWTTRLFFRDHHDGAALLHVRLLASPFGVRTIAFRNRLRTEPDLRRAYEALKHGLAATHAGAPDYDDYTRAKTAFIVTASPT